jgi:predicted aspartyl protease
MLQLAKLDMRYDASGGAYVPMTISGTAVNLLIDTGGVESMLTPSTAQALGLKRFYLVSSSIGYEGSTVDNGVNAPNVKLGGLTGDSMLFAIATKHLPPEEGGTLSNSLLSYYDLDFDFARNKFTIFDPKHCDGAPGSLFTPPFAEVPFTLKDQGHEIVSVELDGRKLDAVVDTGFWHSTADWETIKDLFGMTESTPGITAGRDFGGRGTTYHYPFRTLNFEGVIVNNPDIILAPRSISNMDRLQPQLIIGMDILRRLHIYVAHRERLIYIGSPSVH